MARWRVPTAAEKIAKGRLLTQEQVSEMFGIPLWSLRRYRSPEPRVRRRKDRRGNKPTRGKGPEYVVFERTVRYRYADIKAWVDGRREQGLISGIGSQRNTSVRARPADTLQANPVNTLQ